MSEPQPQLNTPDAGTAAQDPSNTRVILFMVILSVVCAVILSVLASALARPQEIAKDLDRSKQMLIAARMLDYNGYFLIKDENGKYVPAKYTSNGRLVPGTPDDRATSAQILDIYEKRVIPSLLDSKNTLKTFKEAGINLDDYVTDYRKSGYYKQPYKLLYKVLPNPQENQSLESLQEEVPLAYVIPVNGFGLWDAIYGYLAIEPDGDTVIGVTWYDQKETPGLGANIAEPSWQALFPGKKIFLPNPDGTTDFKLAPIGITVVKGKVSEVLGNSTKAQSAVDGMAGATLTGTGVTLAYRDVLSAYRPFLQKLHEEFAKTQQSK